jgi:uncharacterized protein
MKKDGFAPGAPCWADCGTDLEKGPAFYASLFGWTLEDMGPDAGGYTIASLGGGQVAGFGPQQNPGPPVWSVYFHSDDVDKTTELVTAKGGSVLAGPFDVMAAGRMAVYLDPVGAAFSVWQPGEHKGFGVVDEPGTYCWAELVTTDVAASKTFYSDVFGLTVRDSSDPSMAYSELLLDETSVAGMMPKPAEMPAEVPSFWGVYFAVEDTDATLRRVGELGGTTLAGPMDLPVGRFAACADNVGGVFSVIALAQG